MVTLHRVLAAFDHILDGALLLRAVARLLIADGARFGVFAHVDRQSVEGFGRDAAAEHEQRRGENKTKLHVVSIPPVVRQRIARTGMAFNA